MGILGVNQNSEVKGHKTQRMSYQMLKYSVELKELVELDKISVGLSLQVVTEYFV